MNREELYMAETYKCEELKKRLKPITNWDKIEIGTRIFHNDDNNIYNINIYEGINEDRDVISYRNKDNELYNLYTTGWYRYDEFIVDKVEELYTPKLYIINSIEYPENFWFIVAFNEQHLIECFKKEMNQKKITNKEFQDKYNWEQLKNINGFEIILK